MADGVIVVQPDSTGKSLDTEQVVRASDGATVQRERIVLQHADDPSGSRLPEFASRPIAGALWAIESAVQHMRKSLERAPAHAEHRRFSFRNVGASPLRMTNNGSLAVAQVESARAEAARAGLRFWGGTNPINLTPALSPRTSGLSTSSLSLVNTAPETGPSIFVDMVSCWITTAAPVPGATLFAAVSTAPINASYTISTTMFGASCSGSSRAPYGQWTNTTITLPNPVKGSGNSVSPTNQATWFPLIVMDGTGFAGSGGTVYTDGGIAIPPGHCLAFFVLSSQTTIGATFGVNCLWTELKAEME